MENPLRYVQLLALGLWLGAMVYFSFIVAPALFANLPTRDAAGAVVTVVLGRLNKLGIVAGIVYLAAASFQARAAGAGGLLSLRNGLVLLMILLTVFAQFVLSPRMAALRAEMISVDKTPVDHPLRLAFNRYHRYSVWLASATLLAGFVAFYLTSRR